MKSKKYVQLAWVFGDSWREESESQINGEE